MKLRDVQNILSSATTAWVYAAATEKDATDEVGNCVGAFELEKFTEEALDAEVFYIWPQAKDVLQVWVKSPRQMSLFDLVKTLRPDLPIEVIIKSTGAKVADMDHDTVQDLNDIYATAHVKKAGITDDWARVWI